jgi:acetyl esterase/lipase
VSQARFLLDVVRARPRYHAYGSHRQNRAELYAPPGDGPFPVAILIHGGSWHAKYGKWVMRGVARALVLGGRAVWNIEYRRLGRGQHGGWPMTFDDVAAAIDHLATIGDARLDLDDVVLVGHSAGGQLALWAASRADSAVRIGRVLAQAPVTEMRTSDAAHRLLGGTPHELPERFAAVNPIEIGPPPMPLLIVHGAEDGTIPIERSRRYVEAARDAGADVELVEPEPGGHRTHIDTTSAAWRAAADWIAG